MQGLGRDPVMVLFMRMATNLNKVQAALRSPSGHKGITHKPSASLAFFLPPWPCLCAVTSSYSSSSALEADGSVLATVVKKCYHSLNSPRAQICVILRHLKLPLLQLLN